MASNLPTAMALNSRSRWTRALAVALGAVVVLVLVLSWMASR